MTANAVVGWLDLTNHNIALYVKWPRDGLEKQKIMTLTLTVSVRPFCVSVTDVTSPKCNAYSGNESPHYYNGRHGHLCHALATVIGGL